MRKIFTYLEQIVSGKTPITNHLKYTFVIVSVAIIHFIFILFFAFEDIFPLLIYNLISIFIYASTYRFIRTQQYIRIYYIAYVEITIHSLFTTCMIGWEFGFSLYLLVLGPVGFYMSYTLPNIKHRLASCTAFSLALCFFFILFYILTKYHNPVYTLRSSLDITLMYAFNAFITFLMLLLFTILFTIEIQVSQAALEKENKELDVAANVDPLTSLYNRRSMQHFLVDAMERRDEFCLIMCDIDDFKKVNDTYSHDCGDLVLRKIATIIQDNIREGDFACRWGGEEILILTSSADLQCARSIAERIRGSIEESHVTYGKHMVTYTMTFGIAKKTPLRTDIKDIINSADENLYIGKRKGKNCVIG